MAQDRKREHRGIRWSASPIAHRHPSQSVSITMTISTIPTFPDYHGTEGSNATVQHSILPWQTCVKADGTTSTSSQSIIVKIKSPHELLDGDLVANAKRFAEFLSAFSLREWADGRTKGALRLTGEGSLVEKLNSTPSRRNMDSSSAALVREVEVQLNGEWVGEVADKASWMDMYSSDRQVQYKITATMTEPDDGQEPSVAEVSVIFKKCHLFSRLFPDPV